MPLPASGTAAPHLDGLAPGLAGEQQEELVQDSQVENCPVAAEPQSKIGSAVQQPQKQVVPKLKAQPSMKEAGRVKGCDRKIEKFSAVLRRKPGLALAAALVEVGPVVDRLCCFCRELLGSMKRRSTVIGRRHVNHQLRIRVQ